MPLGTYTGWTARERASCSWDAKARGWVYAVRQDQGGTDGQRRSAAVDQGALVDLWTYYSAAAAAAADLVKQRLLLPDDAVRLLKQVLTDMENTKLLPN